MWMETCLSMVFCFQTVQMLTKQFCIRTLYFFFNKTRKKNCYSVSIIKVPGSQLRVLILPSEMSYWQNFSLFVPKAFWTLLFKSVNMVEIQCSNIFIDIAKKEVFSWRNDMNMNEKCIVLKWIEHGSIKKWQCQF